ncbi:acyltransferase [Paraprevotella sp.]|uniref:acyltransferase n=1 Tax=Paraprevotella sp. TaxID=2049036 RepID=UPI00257DFE13|nr:acyltransferase [Paraprevotella sp.]
MLSIGNDCTFSSTIIDVRKSVAIGNGCTFEDGVVIIDSDAHSLDFRDRRISEKDEANKINAAILIGDNVHVCIGSLILKGVTIGNNVRIGPYAVVTKSIPDNCVVEGNPARRTGYV